MRSLVLALVAGLLICAPANAERLTNATLGLSIEKPDDWCNLSASEIANDHRLMGIDNPALEQVVSKYSTPPVFAFFRCRKDRHGVAVTVKVETEPADPSTDESGPDALRAMLRLFSKLVGELNVATAPRNVVIAGKPSGYMALNFTLEVDGKAYSAASETWAIPQRKHFVIVGATYPVDDKAGAQSEVAKIVNSLQLAN